LISDEKIIRLVLSGHSEEYRQLMLRYQDSVFRLACRILGRREDAEDVVQEAFVRAHSNLASCRDRGKFWPWIRRIALNICLRRIPREHPSDIVDDLADAACAQENPVEAEVLRQVAISDLKVIVSGLPALYRTVLVLRYEENLSYQEIAKLIDEDPRVVGTRLHRAKKMLAERLAGVNEI
jgi:RNA polymerase sigma-70 factor (ECF subfamily)